MKGNNELRINQATMIEAMQNYVDSQMAPAPKVLSVEKSGEYGDDYSFVVKVGEKDAA